MNDYEDKDLKSFLEKNSLAIPSRPSDEWENINRSVTASSEKSKWILFGIPAGVAACFLALAVWQAGVHQSHQRSDEVLAAFVFENVEDTVETVDVDDGGYYLSLLE